MADVARSGARSSVGLVHDLLVVVVVKALALGLGDERPDDGEHAATHQNPPEGVLSNAGNVNLHCPFENDAHDEQKDAESDPHDASFHLSIIVMGSLDAQAADPGTHEPDVCSALPHDAPI